METLNRQKSRQSSNNILPFALSKSWYFRQTIQYLKADERGYHRYFLTEPHLKNLADRSVNSKFGAETAFGRTQPFKRETDKVNNEKIENICLGQGPHVAFKQLGKFSDHKETIVLTADVIQEPQQIELAMNSYKNKETKAHAFRPLENLGFAQEQFEYKVDFNGMRIELTFTLRECSLEMTDKTGLKPGDEVVTGLSYRYTPNQLKEILMSHFNDFELFISDDQRTARVICR